MDYITNLDIELEKVTWHAGETLKANILMENSENIKVRAVRVQVRGKGQCQWKLTRSGERRTVRDDQTYIHDKFTVWGQEKKEFHLSTPILHRGKHAWPFTFELPETALPYSFESRIATIRYHLRAIVDIPYASRPTHTKYFTVIGPHIDCMDDKYRVQSSPQVHNPTCFLLPCMKPKSLRVILDRMAYCSGENIRLKCVIMNGSDAPVYVLVELFQMSNFHITRTVLAISKQAKHVAYSYRSDQIESHCEHKDIDLHKILRVPVLPPTLNNDYCSLLQVSYMLKVSLIEEGKQNSELNLEFPFIVGTKPFSIPGIDPPKNVYLNCIDTVEGGMYVSPQFKLGQVYDGTSNNDEDVILYQPVYMFVLKEDETEEELKKHQCHSNKVPHVNEACTETLAEKVSSV